MFRKARATLLLMNATDLRTYRINEIFYSLQGEGYFTGTPAVFLRFSGCNRHCGFCDTRHETHRTMTLSEIIAEVTMHPSRHIILTGGEPLLQVDDALIQALHHHGFFIAVETNGSQPAPEGIDWVTCSPKDKPWNIDRINELKIVYQQQDVEAIADTLPMATHMFLQPCSGTNIPETVAYILKHPHWRLSLQTHKLINIP